MAKSCPRYTFEVKPYRDGKGFEALAFADPYEPAVGRVSARKSDYYKTLRVEESWVNEKHRSCGLGTKLYERIAKASCQKFKKGLMSDTARSEFSEGFWKKQVNKGRARCVVEAMSKHDDPETGIVYGRSGCESYQLTCPTTSLGLVRRRGRRR